MSLADWLHCHLPQGGVSGHVGTAEAFDFITLINIYSHYARAIRSHHVTDTFEQVNKFLFRFSGFPSQRLGYQPHDRNVHVERESRTSVLQFLPIMFVCRTHMAICPMLHASSPRGSAAVNTYVW